MVNPMRQIVDRVTHWLLLAVCAVLLIFSRGQPDMALEARGWLASLFAPVVEVVGAPFQSITETMRDFDELIAVAEYNDQLRAENDRLRAWQAAALRLRDENEDLRALLNLQPTDARAIATPRVIAERGGPYLQAVLLNAGRDVGLSKDAAVSDAHGLVGRVITAGPVSARVLLLTDLNSRVPVLTEGAGTPAILEGDNGPHPRLSFLPVGETVQVGDRIVTSGHGGIFPPRMPVGEVISVEERNIRVRPFADLARLEYLRVWAYAPPPEPEDAVPEEALPEVEEDADSAASETAEAQP